MNFKPTEHQRSVLLSLQFVNYGAAQSGSRPSETPRIASISALFADHDDITVELFDDRDEAALLHRFWRSLRANDQVYAADVAEGLSLLRHRSWLLDVIPAPEIDLRCVYAIQLWDTARMWKKGYSPRPLYIEGRSASPIEVEASIYEESEFVHSRD
jgi:hypothetical protein